MLKFVVQEIKFNLLVLFLGKGITEKDQERNHGPVQQHLRKNDRVGQEAETGREKETEIETGDTGIGIVEVAPGTEKGTGIDETEIEIRTVIGKGKRKLFKFIFGVFTNDVTLFNKDGNMIFQ